MPAAATTPMLSGSRAGRGLCQDPPVRFRLAATLAPLAALAVLAAGCGSSGPKSNGVADKSAQEIVTTALAAAKAASSVHVTGTINTGAKAKVDLYLVRNVGGKGSITTNGSTFELVSVGGKVYVKADATALQQLGGSAVPAAAAQLLAGKWFVVPSSIPQLSSVSSLTDIGKLFGAALNNSGNLTKGDETKINGQKAIGVTSSSKDGTLYVATTGTAYPLQIAGSKNQGSVNFTDWDSAVDVKAPPNPVDLSKLVGG
jgi:hypothetical protein